MSFTHLRERLFVCMLLALTASLASAADIGPLFDLASPQTGPFPSNRFSVLELRNLTALRVNLPKPNCAQRPSDCEDIDVLNSLDGFNAQPRLRIPFNGPIDPASVNSSNVFLVRLSDATQFDWRPRQTVGINQIVWDPASNTLYAESDEFLEEHTTYALIVTDGIRTAAGHRISGRAFHKYWWDFSFLRHREALLYRASLLAGVTAAKIPPQHIVAASVFTTQSTTAVLEKIRNQIKHAHPASADFALGSDGSRTVYPLPSLTAVLFNRQVGAAPTFQTSPVPLPALNVVPNSVATVAFGRYRSPVYQTSQQFIPAIGTRSGVPAVQRTDDVYFNLFLPTGTRPANGWPVAIFGHGFGDTKQGVPVLVASVLASRGIASISINVVGHGGGALGTLSVIRANADPVTLSAGGRGFDQDGNGTIDSTEGLNATTPRRIIDNRDGLRQSVADLMQLVRVIETGGIDVDGDGTYDLDAGRIYYAGQSLGGIYGTIFLGVESSVHAGVTNVAGGSLVEVARLGVFRPLLSQALAVRTPVLLNAPPLAPPLWGFNENLPLRDQPAVINDVPGAIDIQNFIEASEWVSQSGNPVAYAPHIRKNPLRGSDPKAVILQVAKGDGAVPNPTSTAIARAGDLADRVTYYRNDLAFAADPAVPKNPHGFIAGIGSAATAPFAIAAQSQIAVFFASDGATVIDPDGAGPFFETPIVPPLPETLNFIP